MIRLVVLGDVDLRDHGGAPVSAVLNQSRRFSVLLYLALVGRHTAIRRDTLLGIFWPDQTEAQARHALSQSLHFLRRHLGRETIVSGRAEVGVVRGLLSCDAVDFVEALERGDDAAALRCYGGDLLPGFFADGAPEFEDWLELERQRLRSLAADAAWRLADAEERAGEPISAGATARRAAKLARADEPAVRRLISLLGRIGDRAGALEAYQDLARRLAEEYSEEPTEATRLALAQLHPLSSSVPVSTTPAGVAIAAAAGQREPVAGGELGGREPARLADRLARLWRKPVWAVLLLFLTLALFSLWGLDRTRGRPAPGLPRLRLEEVTASGQLAGRETLGQAFLSELAGQLSEAPALVELPDAVVASATHAQPGGAGTPVYVLRTGITVAPGRLALGALLLDGVSGAVLARVSLERESAEPWTAMADLAGELSATIRRQLGQEARRRAWQREGVAREAWTSVELGIRDRARADSLVYAGAADAAALTFDQADSGFARAAVLAPGWATPRIEQANTDLRRMWLNLLPPRAQIVMARTAIQDGLRDAAQALAEHPLDPAAHEARAVLRYWRWLTFPTDSLSEVADLPAKVEAELRQVVVAAPARARSWSFLSALLHSRGEFAAANIAAVRAYSADAYLDEAPDILIRLFTSALEIGDRKSATQWCQELGRRYPGLWVNQYCALSQLAWEPELERAQAMAASAAVRGARDSAAAGEPETAARLDALLSVVYARAGMRVAAEQALARALAPHTPDLELLPLEAWARLALGQSDSAVALLRHYAAAEPRASAAVLRSRRFASLPITAPASR